MDFDELGRAELADHGHAQPSGPVVPYAYNYAFCLFLRMRDAVPVSKVCTYVTYIGRKQLLDGVLMSVASALSARRLGRSQSRLVFAQGSPPADVAQPLVASYEAQLQSLRAELRELETETETLKGRIASCVQAVPASARYLLDPQPDPEILPEEEHERRRTQSLVDGESARSECGFFFVAAEWILAQSRSVPRFQDLRTIDGALVQKTLEIGRAYRSEYAEGELLAVSHRWETQTAPDTEGEQLRRIQVHLRARPHIRYVWYDYWCMPQGNRSPSDKLHFHWMLGNVNLLYVGCSVLILLDISYLSRFWTQMEAWLSMQHGSTGGLQPAPEDMRRCTIEFLHTATETTRADLVHMWATRQPNDACALLSQPDVQVTNASDKSTQLEKVRGLDALVCEAHSALAAAQKARGGATWADLLAGGFSASVLQEASVLGTDEAVVQALPALASKVGMDARSLCWARALDFESKGIKEDDVPVLAGLLCASASLTSVYAPAREPSRCLLSPVVI